MRTRTRQSKSSRKPSLPGRPRSLASRLRRYIPWVTAICASAYLPPQVLSVNWTKDADGNWSTPTNWSGPVPTTTSDTATFFTNFTQNRTVTLDIDSSIASISVDDPKPTTTLTIASDNVKSFLMQSSGLTLNVEQNSALVLNSSATGIALLRDAGAGQVGRLIKTGEGTAFLTNNNTYTGPTIINRGAISVAVLADGGAPSPIGASTSMAANLVLNQGALRYTGSGHSTDRLMTIGEDFDDMNGVYRAGGTIDASGSGALVFDNLVNPGTPNDFTPGSVAASSGTGTHTLVLRGTSTAANYFNPKMETLPGGGVFALTKQDTGTWRITADHTYEGMTTIQRGILSLDYTKGVPAAGSPPSAAQLAALSRLPDGSPVALGGLPGGGVLELLGGAAVERIGSLELRPGTNIIQANTGTSVLYVPDIGNIARTRGATMRISGGNVVRTDSDVPAVLGMYGGWLTINDNWAGGSNVGGTDYNLVEANAAIYVNVDVGSNPPSQWGAEDNISIAQTSFESVNGADLDFGYVPINSLRFTGGPGPNKELRIENGGGPVITSKLVIQSGGILQASSSGFSHIRGGGVTSNSGELFFHSRANAVVISTGLFDYADPQTSEATPLTVTKTGGGNIIFQDDPLKLFPSIYTGNLYINEGGVLVRSNDALGAATASNDDGTTATTFVNGGFLDFQGVQYLKAPTALDPTPVQETVYVYAGEVRASIGRSAFHGQVVSSNPDAQATLNIGTWLDLNGNLGEQSGGTVKSSGFVKTGAGTLVVNGNTTISTSTSPFAGAGDINLTAGNSVWNGSIALGTNNSLLVTGGQHVVAGALSGSRVSVTAGTLGVTRNNTSFNPDFQMNGGTTNLASLTQPSNQKQTYTGLTNIGGGAVILNGSVDFTNAFTLATGTLTEVASFAPGVIPTATWSNSVDGAVVLNSTTTLNFNNVFVAQPVIGATTFTANGIGVTEFRKGVLQNSGSTLNLVNTVIGVPVGQPGATAVNFTVAGGTQRFNGLNNVTGLLTINTGAFTQEGVRRAGNGAYGVRDTFTGGILLNSTSGALNTLINGANAIGGNLTVGGTAAGYTGFTTTTTEVQLNNAQTFTSTAPGTGNLVLNGGRAWIQSAQALGGGSSSATSGGVSITGEKSQLLITRGTATSTGGSVNTSEDITLGFTTGYVAGLVLTNRGAGYTANPTVGFSGATGTTAASYTATASGTVSGFTNGGVGAGYAAAPTVTLTGGGTPTTVATAVAVLGGPTILRANSEHNVWNGNIILDNISGGVVSKAIPVISVNADDSLAITGDIYGSATTVTSGAAAESRFLTTAIPGGVLNSSNGIFILDGQVRDKAVGQPIPTLAKDFLRTEWGGNQELNVWVNKEWGANGLTTLATGIMRYTQNNTASLNFFGTGITPNFEISVGNLNNTSIGWNATSQNIGLFLTKGGATPALGQVFNAPTFTIHNGNTDKLGTVGGSTGNITIGGENTSGFVTIGTGTGSINLETDTTGQIRDVRLFANTGGTVDIKSNFIRTGVAATQSGSITKIGDGTVRLLGTTASATNLLDRVNIMGGLLEFSGYETASAVRVNGTGSTLTLGGGNLRILGHATGGATVLERFNGIATIGKGGSAVEVSDPGNVGTQLQIANGVASSRATGGTVRFAEVGTLASITFNSSSLTKQFPLGWATHGTSLDATSANAATHFMSLTATGLVDRFNTPAAGLSNSPGAWSGLTAANGHFEEVANGTGFSGASPITANLTVNTIKFTSANASANGATININAGQTLRVNEGILVSSLAAGNRNINGGSLGGGGTYPDFFIHNYGGTLTIGSQIVDSTGSGTKGIVVTGDGQTVFTNNANSFTGNLYLNNGKLSVSDNGQLGAAANGIFLDGGILSFTQDVTMARPITVYGDRSTISIDPGKTLTYNSFFKSEANVQNVGTSTPYLGLNSFNGDIVFSGGGTIRQSYDSTVAGNFNSLLGQVTIGNATRFIHEGNSTNFLGATANSNTVSYSPLDGTFVDGGTLEIRPTTVNFSGLDYLSLKGAGQDGLGALRMTRATSGVGATVDRVLSWTGPVTLAGDATIFVDDLPETGNLAGAVGMISFDDNIVNGGNGVTNFALTKTGQGILRFVNNRTTNLPTINVQAGELRFEAGITAVIGNNAGLTPDALKVGAYSGTSNINVGVGGTGGFAGNPRLWFADARGVHTTNINLSGGFLIATSTDAPLQSVNFGGAINLTGTAATNAIEIAATTRANPTVAFGPVTGTGGFTKLGVNELQLVNSGSTFQGAMVISRGGFSATSPSVGLYDAGSLLNLSEIRITNDGSFHIDNQNGLDANAGNDSVTETVGAPVGRLANSADLHVSGAARLRYLGNNAGTGNQETIGDLAVHRGSSAVELDGGTASGINKNIGLTFSGGYTRDQGGVVQFRVLDPGVTIGAGTGNNTANIKITGTVPANLFLGGNGAAGTSTTNVLVGAFGGVATQSFGTIGANTTLTTALNNNEQTFIGRNLLTHDAATGVVRPLAANEYLTPTIVSVPNNPNNQSGDFYTFAANETPNQNVRLTGDFGPFTSYIQESAFATEGLFQPPFGDSSRRQDSTYRVENNFTINSLSFAQDSDEFTPAAGNRLLLEIGDGKVLTVNSGMIVAGGKGYLQDTDPVNADATDQRTYIRGGKLEFNNREIIIHNVAGSFRENSGTWTIANGDMFIYSTLSGSGGLTKSGPSTLVLAGANTYTGPTNITEGILQIENSLAFGATAGVTGKEVIVSGSGDIRMRRAIEVGSATNKVTLRYTDNSISSLFVNVAEYNTWHGNIEIDNTTSAGERPWTVTLLNNNANATMVLDGDIYGLPSTAGGVDPLNDTSRGTARSSRQVVIQGVGGVTQLKGSFRDTPTGPISAPFTPANEQQVLRSVFTGNNENNFWLYRPWDSAGNISMRQGQIILQPEAGLQFYTDAASGRINPLFAGSRPAIGDAGGGDVALLLSVNGQVFNAPNLTIGNSTVDATYMIGGLNTTGSVAFMHPAGNAAADATQRVNTWDHNVRLYAAAGGNVNVLGKITDTNSAGGLMKIGPGTVTMQGMAKTTAGWANNTTTSPSVNDFKKQIIAGGGKLVLDYATNDVGTLATGTLTNGWGTAAVNPVFAGGILELQGDTDNNVVQNWTGLTMRPGGSELVLNPGAGKTLTLNISGNFLQLPSTNGASNAQPTAVPGKNGSTLNIVNLGGANGIFNLTATGSLTAAAGTGGYLASAGNVLGAWATYGTAQGQATHFAMRSTATGNPVGPYTGYTLPATTASPNAWLANTHVTEGIVGNPNVPFDNTTAVSGVKTIRFSAPTAATTLNLPANFMLGPAATAALDQADEGGILVPTGVSAAKTITGGSLTVNQNKDLYIHNYGTGLLTVDSSITGSLNLVIAGTGTTKLGNQNNAFTGATYVNGGVLSAESLADANQTTQLKIVSTLLLDNNGQPVPDGMGGFVRIPTNQATVVTGNPTTNLNIGQFLSGSTFDLGTVVTGVSTATVDGVSVTTVTFSKVANALNDNVTGLFGNSLGTNSAAGLFLTGGTLRSTAKIAQTVQTSRPIILGGNGGTIELVNPTSPAVNTTLQLNGVISSPANPALQNTAAHLTRNPYVGSLTKTGGGTLLLNGANTYQGMTDVKAGVLGAVTTSTTVFGTSYGELDSTIVRSGAALQFSHTGGTLASTEWMTFEGNTTIDLKYSSAQQVTQLDGVITLGSLIDPGLSVPRDHITVTYTGGAGTAVAGNATLQFGNAGGYLRGSGTITKDTFFGGVTTANPPAPVGSGGSLTFSESNPEWTGGLEIEGGRVFVRSPGKPLGSGVVPIELGTRGDNTITFGGAPENNTPLNANVFSQANLYFQPETIVASNGAATVTGLPDNVITDYRISQDIIINKPTAGTQTKFLGVIGAANSLDTFNFDGRLLIDDDLTLFVDANLVNVPTAGQTVLFNLNNALVTGSPDPVVGSPGRFFGNITTMLGNLNSGYAVAGVGQRIGGATLGQYSDFFVNFNLNGDNSQFAGDFTIGNIPSIANTPVPGIAVGNPDANHVLSFGSSNALNSRNAVNVYDDATIRLNGHSVTMGSLVTPGSQFVTERIGQIQFQGGTPLNGFNRESGTTADIGSTFNGLTSAEVRDSQGNLVTVQRSIVENASSTAATLTITQDISSKWNSLIRNGVQSDGVTPGAALSIVKAGSGIAQIDHPNYYTGGTTVTGGLLQVNNDVGRFDDLGDLQEAYSATGPGTVTVTNTGGLSGAGFITGRVEISGRISPGQVDLASGAKSSGIINLGSRELGLMTDSAMHAGTILDLDIFGKTPGLFDVVSTPKLTIDGQVSFQLNIDAQLVTIFNANPITLQGGDRFTVIDTKEDIVFGPNAAFDFFGNPTGLNQDITYDYGNGAQQIFRVILTDDGNDITLVAVPEPGTVATLASGLGMLLGLQRFRRRSRQA